MHNLELLEDATHRDDIHFSPKVQQQQPQVEADSLLAEETFREEEKKKKKLESCLYLHVEESGVVRFQWRV